MITLMRSKLPILLLAGWIACVLSCKKVDAQAGTKSKPLVATVTVEPRSLERTLDLTGTVEASRVAKVASPAEGPVLAAHVREGDRVKAGQVLVSIGRQAEALADVASARESLALEKRNLERVEHLVAIGASAGEEAERARLAVSQAQAKLAAASQGSSDHQIRAPWSGVVSRVLTSDGAFVAPREIVVEVFDPASLVIRLAAPETHALLVQKDARAHVMLDARPGKTFQGAVSRVYPELDRRTRARTVEVSLPEPDALVPGMFARVRIVTETLGDAVAVLEDAVMVSPGGDSFVFVLEQGTARRRKVRTGADIDAEILVLEGVSPGDQLIVRGQESLEDGMAVRTGPPKPAGSSSAGPTKGPSKRAGATP